MSMRDLNSNISVVTGLVPQTITSAGGAKNTGDIDLQGFNSAAIICAFGASGDVLSSTVFQQVKLEHADDNGAGAPGTYAAVTVKDVDIKGTLSGVPQVTAPDASGNIVLVDAAAEASNTYQFGYVGNKRFIRATTTPSAGNTSGMTHALIIVKGAASVAQ